MLSLGSTETDCVIMLLIIDYSKITILGAMTWSCCIENRMIMSCVIMRLNCTNIMGKCWDIVVEHQTLNCEVLGSIPAGWETYLLPKVLIKTKEAVALSHQIDDWDIKP